ncbi:hypothetical protein RUND412_005533 [Rhizina undulata]
MPAAGDMISPAIHSPTENNDEPRAHQFTAVNNNGNGGPLIGGHHHSIPSPALHSAGASANTTGPTSMVNSPQMTLPPPTEDHWRQNNSAGSAEAAANAQKRKRTPEQPNSQRAVTPTTRTTHHHLAAHEAALGAEEHRGNTNHQSLHSNIPGHHPNIQSHQPSSMTSNDDLNGGLGAVNHYLDEDVKMPDEGAALGVGNGAGEEGSPGPTTQVEHKRRKRVFSNRTKTGCITCRRRKKKCDEGKPECCNCKRGGFVCEGYSGKINWQKPPGKSGNSSAGGRVSVEQPESTSASPTPSHVRLATVAQKQAASRKASVELPRQESPQPRTATYNLRKPAAIIVDDSKLSSDDSLSPNTQTQFIPPHQSECHQQVPHHHPQYTSLTLLPQGIPSSIPAAPPADIRNISISHPTIAGPSRLAQQHSSLRSEKEKMINSELYHASAPELVEDRERCKAACWRFNNAAMNPNLGISKAEKGRLLMEVLRPHRKWDIVTHARGQSDPLITYVAEGGIQSDIVDVQVDAPFTCSYGYNIRLGQDVLIEFGCTILDSCAVTIKARTILSSNVSIYSATHPIDPRKRNGAKGPEMAKPVTIEEDCWLGGNVIVLGGITIGKGSVVGAGSVVTRDVPPFTVVAGNPARVIRGIYQNGADM